jgi:hypothetical protein
MKEQLSEDDKWLATVAGQAEVNTNLEKSRQAVSIRKALLAQAIELDKRVPKADETLYQKIRINLQHEGVFATPAKPGVQRQAQKKDFIDQSVQWIAGALGIERNRLQGLQVWGGVVVLGCIALILYARNPTESTVDVQLLRRSNSAIVLIVKNPTERLAELQLGLQTAGQSITIGKDASGQPMFDVKATPAVLDYLSTQRIEPMVVEGRVYIKLAQEP